jgi:hypothetical protein
MHLQRLQLWCMQTQLGYSIPQHILDRGYCHSSQRVSWAIPTVDPVNLEELNNPAAGLGIHHVRHWVWDYWLQKMEHDSIVI